MTTYHERRCELQAAVRAAEQEDLEAEYEYRATDVDDEEADERANQRQYEASRGLEKAREALAEYIKDRTPIAEKDLLEVT